MLMQQNYMRMQADLLLHLLLQALPGILQLLVPELGGLCNHLTAHCH